MPDIFGLKQVGRATTGGLFYATPTERVEAGAIYVPNESSPLFGVAEYPVEAGTLGAFTTEGTFVFDKPGNWIDDLGRKVFFRPSSGEIVNQDRKGDALIGFQVFANIPDNKLGVFLTQGEISVVILVTSTADSGAGSLRQAILDAQNGDVILFDSTVFPAGATTAILLSSHFAVNKQLTIDAGANETPRVALDAQNNSRCLYLQPGASGTLRGLLFCNASNSTNGGAVYCSATNPITFTQCRFSNNQGNTGGGLSTTTASTITFDACEFSGNTANNGGAVYGSNSATLTFDDCTFSGNTADSSGGAVIITNSVQATLDNCTIRNCTAASGGCVCSASASQNTLNDCTITDCSATNGGGVYSSGTSQNTLNNCVISGCSATSNGGGLNVGSSSQCVLNRCLFSGCTAANGGCLFARDTPTTFLNSCTITNCTASNTGGAFYSRDSAETTLNGCKVDSDAYIIQTSMLLFDTSNINSVYAASTASLRITSGVVTVATANFNSSVITIADGAALTITTSATIGAATFTSAGRAYLATATGLDFSAATLNNVVACTYGAGLESFKIDADGATWTAQDLTTPILIETRGSDATWTTLSDDATGGTYSDSFDVGTTARAFDGVRFFVASLDAYWQVNASVASNANGGGGTGSASPSWTVENETITPNLEG